MNMNRLRPVRARTERPWCMDRSLFRWTVTWYAVSPRTRGNWWWTRSWAQVFNANGNIGLFSRYHIDFYFVKWYIFLLVFRLRRCSCHTSTQKFCWYWNSTATFHHCGALHKSADDQQWAGARQRRPEDWAGQDVRGSMRGTCSTLHGGVVEWQSTSGSRQRARIRVACCVAGVLILEASPAVLSL